jgi:hypothetical protein
MRFRTQARGTYGEMHSSQMDETEWLRMAKVLFGQPLIQSKKDGILHRVTGPSDDSSSHLCERLLSQ